MQYTLHWLGPDDDAQMRALNVLFHAAFDADPAYRTAPPDTAYLSATLANPDVIVLCAQAEETLIGGLVAYRLPKLEQARSEIYVYDLAVASQYRRRGVATAMLTEIRHIAAETGAWVVYIQADHDDPPAAALYSKLGTREEVLHFDLTPLPRQM